MTAKVTKTVKTTARHELVLDRKAIVAALMLAHPEIPEDAVVYMKVPGGGDWSNTDMFVGTDANINCFWVDNSTITE